ncbi:Tripartite tricarboxylate transporter TctB family protein [Thalassoglobus neptunius]|uniref:Tripartite tricarboxylate transporter TctB family protein n=1 Tax=Thalassoglobus neptunius TaxID=1938619 RepID=A0A5C5X263_9PLAN|nr:tripartite tricarboxylate transporter TctB family protein [Thalassoglobus neptunius]TWT56920.1 Tripartite tricarboxylate transporter TctB family protein [Thalassoglobus neptunius]
MTETNTPAHSPPPPDDPTPESVGFSEFTGTLSYGVFLCILGASAIYFAKDFRAIALSQSDPGPRAIPVACGVIMIIGGLWQFAVAWRKRQQSQTDRDQLPVPSELSVDETKQRRRGNLRALVTLGLLIGYVILLPTFGFIVATIVFGILVLKNFGSPWSEAVIATASISAVVYVLFVNLFQVMLPQAIQQLQFF